MENNEKIAEMLRKIDALSSRYAQFQKEINALKAEVLLLKKQEETIDNQEVIEEKPYEILQRQVPPPPPTRQNTPPQYTEPEPDTPPQYPIIDWEKFIGENLANKVGIVVLVLGIGIGVKYAIDNNLISPLTRIILGYMLSFGLVGVSVKLREKYNDLSAVILSGALCSLYFVTYIAYDFYHLIPQLLAFIMMVVITVFAVISALSYNLEIIALMGLVGAYFVPFLLSNNEGRPAILFSYMLLVNSGILYIAFKKDWKITNYTAFIMSWFIYMLWYVDKYYDYMYFYIGFIFAILFFILFYITFLAYKFINNKPFSVPSVSMLLLNSVVFYGIGYAILQDNTTGKHLLGLFTLGNAVVHFLVSIAIFKRELADKNLFFVVSGLVLTFITLAIPVQFEGHWVSIFWACELSLLFWIGRTQQVAAYEKLSYPLILLNVLSIIVNVSNYNTYFLKEFMPLFNIYFLTFIIIGASFYFVYFINNKEAYKFPEKVTLFSRNTLSNTLSTIIIILCYLSFNQEISHFFDVLYKNSLVKVPSINNIMDNAVDERYNDNILNVKTIWLIYYTIAFVIGLIILNIYKLKSIILQKINTVLSLIMLVYFLMIGLYVLGSIKNTYINQDNQLFKYSVGLLFLRYIGYVLIGFLAYFMHKSQKIFSSNDKDIPIMTELIIHTTTLWCIASEMVNLLEIMHFNGVYKTALSILFGVYALAIIVYGINVNKKHLRMAGIFLFATTLGKLFFYDLANLDTIPKTIIMIVLGGLLLIVSFIYNKTKNENLNP